MNKIVVSGNQIKVIQVAQRGLPGATGPMGATGATGAAGTTSWTGITDKPSSFPPSAHEHDATEITSGIIATARLGSGIADGTKYHAGNQTWRDFAGDVRAALAVGLSTATNAVITAADTFLIALGKLQKQISDNLSSLTSHTANTSNPHAVTKTQVGLSDVENTKDSDKPISDATQDVFNQFPPPEQVVWQGANSDGANYIKVSAVDSREIVDFSQTNVLIKTDSKGAIDVAVPGTDYYNSASSIPYSILSGVPSTFEPSAHNHAASAINSGVMATARLGTGTATSSNFLRGDGAWVTPSGGVSIGGAITSATAKSALFADASGNLAQDNANYAYNATTHQLELTGDNTTGILLKKDYYPPKIEFNSPATASTFGIKLDYNRLLFEGTVFQYIAFGTSGGFPPPVQIQPYLYETNAAPNNFRLKAEAANATDVPFVAKAHASQSVDIVQWRKSDDTNYSRINKNGYFITAKTSAPADAELNNSEMAVWYNEAANMVMFKVKTSAGTIKNAALIVA